MELNNLINRLESPIQIKVFIESDLQGRCDINVDLGSDNDLRAPQAITILSCRQQAIFQYFDTLNDSASLLLKFMIHHNTKNNDVSLRNLLISYLTNKAKAYTDDNVDLNISDGEIVKFVDQCLLRLTDTTEYQRISDLFETNIHDYYLSLWTQFILTSISFANTGITPPQFNNLEYKAYGINFTFFSIFIGVEVLKAPDEIVWGITQPQCLDDVFDLLKTDFSLCLSELFFTLLTPKGY
ncbi:hypothetical protein [Photobacterium leiognathi]|uniref:hypothetical protein n=1 Tax=Photobacterium leiognathi TaxID=553611 RepID=UPI002982AFFD|nr:hypothetical protein [Photobacterium leiognathi]